MHSRRYGTQFHSSPRVSSKYVGGAHLWTSPPPPPPPSSATMASHLCYVTVRDLKEIAPEVARIGAVNRIRGLRRASKNKGIGLVPIDVSQVLNTRGNVEFRVYCLVDHDTIKLMHSLPNTRGFVVYDLSCSANFWAYNPTIHSVAIPSSRGGMVLVNPYEKKKTRVASHSLCVQLAASILTSAIHTLKTEPMRDNPFEDWQREFAQCVDIFDGAGRNCQLVKDWTKRRVAEMSARPNQPTNLMHVHNLSDCQSSRSYESDDSGSSASASSSSSCSSSILNLNDIENLHSIALRSDFVRGPLPHEAKRYTPSLLTPPKSVELLKWEPSSIVSVR